MFVQVWFMVLCFTTLANLEGSLSSQTSFLIRNESGKSVEAYAYSRKRYILPGDRTFTFWYPLHATAVNNKDNQMFVFQWLDDSRNNYCANGKGLPVVDAKVIVKGRFRKKEHRIFYIMNKDEDANNEIELLVKNPYKKRRKKDIKAKT